MTNIGPFAAIEDGRALAQAIVDTVREPLLVLDKDLRVIAASRSFYDTFRADPQDTQGRLLYTLGDRQWDIPALRMLLEKILPEQFVMNGYEVEHEFPDIKVVARRLGYYNLPQEQQVAEDLLNKGEPIDAIVALSHITTRGAFYALVEFGKVHTVKLVGFDQDLMPPIRTGGIDSIIMQSTYDMGRIAMEIMDAQLHGRSVPSVSVVPPLLMTGENIDSPEIRQQLTADWWAKR